MIKIDYFDEAKDVVINYLAHKYDSAYLDEYFKQEHRTYLHYEDEKLVGVVGVRFDNYVFNDLLIGGCFVIYLDDYYLLDAVIEELSYSRLITLARPDVNILERGFKNLYNDCQYEISRLMFGSLHYQNIREDLSKKELANLYYSFMRHFNGYKFRSEEDFKGKYIGYEKTGYAHIIESKMGVMVDEIIYLNKEALDNMLMYLVDRYDVIYVRLSTIESLKHLQKEYANLETMYLRINDVKLFKKLIKEIRLPLWIREEL